MGADYTVGGLFVNWPNAPPCPACGKSPPFGFV